MAPTNQRAEDYGQGLLERSSTHDLPSANFPDFPRRSSNAERQNNIALRDDHSAAHVVVRNLSRFALLGAGEVAAIHQLARIRASCAPGEVLVHEHAHPEQVHMLLSGVACRYKQSRDGRRQVIGFIVPGDLFEIEYADGSVPDHSIAALGQVEVARAPIPDVVETRSRYPVVQRALELSSVVNRAILREWLLSVGQRTAIQRVGHLFCELATRLDAVGHLPADGSIRLPINQSVLADTTGLTKVHVNRTLQRLRREGYITFGRGRLNILDVNRLGQLADFDADYLRVACFPI